MSAGVAQVCGGFKNCVVYRSVSMGALGSSAALRAAAVTSLGLSNSMAASQGGPPCPLGCPPPRPRPSQAPHAQLPLPRHLATIPCRRSPWPRVTCTACLNSSHVLSLA